ncbi:MAG: sugar phosphate isomerase/epimerase [Lachnospiraceae bacterium]|jgi:L-ribulose-5-phosphate 3-epimerase|nr:sugar phosphate isomerase/epimerase [uncultured Acetatifactor sp.]MCI9229896.1 sugar phosphate isomerase/epimerase [Lachnospiraceae bacterium]MCI9574751.1 sugar phosphate isomerase/epimerase [Lachnospiraceae bacterium]
MQLGIRLHDTAKCPFEERIADVHRMGFACGQLALSKLIDEFPTTDETLTPGLAMYIKNVFARNQVDIAVLGCYLNLANPDKGQLAETIRHYLAHIRFASWLGCGMVGTETGTPNESYSYTPECHTEAALLTFMENLRPVVAYAEKMGVVIGIEPVCRHIVGTPKRARRVLDEIASPNLQIIFDPVNLLDAGNYREKDSVIEEAIELLGPDVAAIHLKDCVMRDGELIFTGCGQGEMDYKPILRFVKEHKPFIHVLLEETRPENSQRARHYMARMYGEA